MGAVRYLDYLSLGKWLAVSTQLSFALPADKTHVLLFAKACADLKGDSPKGNCQS